MSRVERTKSFLKASIIKRWKSSKELFTKTISSSHGTSTTASSAHDSNCGKAARKFADNQSGKFINEKVLDNLDEFERNFLLSAGRKILVRELRKNFEKSTPDDTLNNSKKCVSSQNGLTSAKQNSVPFKNNKNRDDVERYVMKGGKNKSVTCSSSMQNIGSHFIVDSYRHGGKNVNETMAGGGGGGIVDAVNNNSQCIGEKKQSALVSRHSFYNTYRNEYCTWQNNNCASNLSIVSCGVSQNNCEKTLEKTINDYKKFNRKSSSSIDLTSIPSFVLNTTVSSIEKTALLRKHRYSSVVNINHSESNQNFADTAVHSSKNLDANCIQINGIDKTMAGGTTDDMVNDRLVVRKNCQLKQTCSMKSLNNMATVYHGKTNNVSYRNFNDDTKSLIVASNTSTYNLYDSRSNLNEAINRKYFGGSTVTLNSEISYDQQSMLSTDYDNISCADNRIIINTKLNDDEQLNNHDANGGGPDNNNNNTMKLRKSFSINQIDLNLLKNELDEFIDREWRATNFGKNTLAHRRRHFESALKKVFL